MNNLNKDKELLKKIYSEHENSKPLTEERKEGLEQIINNDNVTKENTFIQLKDKLKSIEIGRIILDLIKGALNLISVCPWT